MNIFKIKGITLTNLLIGLSLGLIISAGVIQSIYSQKKTYYAQNANLALFENGRYAIHLLHKIISNSAYLGCFNGSPTNVIESSSRLNDLASFSQGVLGYEGTGSGFSPSLPSFLSGLSLNSDSDAITIEGLSTTTEHIQSAMSQENDDIQIHGDIEPNIGDVLLISDCNQANLFRVSLITKGTNSETLHYDATYNTQNGSKSSNAKLSKAYGLSAHIGKYSKQSVYVSNNDNGNSALWLTWLSTSGQQKTEELIEGVEKLNILYGYDSTGDGSANTYLSASNISNWNNVVSLRIHVLMNSIEKIGLSQSSYTYQNQTYSASDGLIRQEFSTTIKLNSKGLS